MAPGLCGPGSPHEVDAATYDVVTGTLTEDTIRTAFPE
jgi:hypothetical protein